VELVASLEKAKAGFRYLTGIQGTFEVREPGPPTIATGQPLDHWLGLARRQRRDMAAVRIETLVADHEVDQILMKYAPSLNLFGEFKADNAEAQRFDDDPFSWTVGASLSVNIWDGGIREAELEMARSRLRQAQMAEEDLLRKIESDVDAAYQALEDATAARVLAERQLEVARDTQKLAKAAEQAGAATNLEVIDANTMVFASEAQFSRASLEEAMALLDLLSACGSPIPFGDQ
jgi:outer membrane protein TolC